MIDIVEITPHTKETTTPLFSFFLAGTIDMGNSENWQANVIQTIKDMLKTEELDNASQNITIHIYNPRRAEGFDESNKEDKEYQINWELEHLEKCNLIIMNLLDNSKSPISLLELGLFSKSNKLNVICSPNFYRYDNVRITCKRYNIPLFNNLKDMFNDVKFF